MDLVNNSSELSVRAPRLNRVINLLGVTIHVDTTIGTSHLCCVCHVDLSYWSAMFSLPYLKALAIQISSLMNLSSRRS